MFFKRGNKQEEKKQDVKRVNKLLGKDSGRRVFGFACSPHIPTELRGWLPDSMSLYTRWQSMRCSFLPILSPKPLRIRKRTPC